MLLIIIRWLQKTMAVANIKQYAIKSVGCLAAVN
jgi:hypothetical protein